MIPPTSGRLRLLRYGAPIFASGAKAQVRPSLNGTAEAVPLHPSLLLRVVVEAFHLGCGADDGEACWVGGELGLAEDDDSVFGADFLAGDLDEVEGVLL